MIRRLSFIIFLSLVIICIQLVTVFKPDTDKNISNISAESILLKDMVIHSAMNSDVILNDIYITLGKNDVPVRLKDKLDDGCLVFRFYGESCNICVDDIISNLKNAFPDYSTNNRLLLLGSNLNQRVLVKYYGKEVLLISNEGIGLPAEEYNLPLLFYADQLGISKIAFVPDKAFPELTQGYLNHIKTKYFDY